MRIPDLPSSDQPRNKVLRNGIRSLTDSELLALIINKGTKNQNAKDLALAIMSHYQNDLDRLFRSGTNDLMKFSGIGLAKASTLAATFELGRRYGSFIPPKRTIIQNSKDVFNFVKNVFSLLSHEEFVILLLNNNNEIVHTHRLSMGGMTGTVADGRILFKLAFDYRATAIILCHNHPSGNPKPSEYDRRLTLNFQKFGSYIDLHILDHIIYTDFGYFSFADEGLLSNP